MPNRQGSGEEHLPVWKRETKVQHGVSSGLTFFVRSRSASATAARGLVRIVQRGRA
jgi:hypothetical protein